MPNITIAGASYQDVPAISVPKTGGGTALFPDVSPTTATAADVAQGKIFFASDGSQQTGTASGGGGGGVERKDVNFYDYDGTLLHSYTAQEAAALTALPANPSHTGLTAQGWNYTLAQMKTQITATGECDLGQMYKPTDGKTHIHISIPEFSPPDQMVFAIRCTQSVARGVTFDWGDGSDTQTYTGTSASTRSHTYAQPGDYDITLEVTSGTLRFIGTSSAPVFVPSGTYNYNRSRVRKVFLGDNVTEISYLFSGSVGVEAVILPKGITIGDYAIYNVAAPLKHITVPENATFSGSRNIGACPALSSISLPYGLTSLSSYAVYNAFQLDRLVLPCTLTSMGTYAISGGGTSYVALQRIVVPGGVTALSENCLRHQTSMREVILQNGLTSIANNAFYAMYGLQDITIPATVTSITSGAFASCQGISRIKLLSTTPPALSGTSLGDSMATGYIIEVPYSADHSVLTAYQTAWSSLASKMQEAPA